MAVRACMLWLFLLSSAAVGEEQAAGGSPIASVAPYVIPDNADAFTCGFLRLLQTNGATAAVAFAESAGAQHVEALIKLLGHPDYQEVTPAAARALLALGPPAVPLLVKEAHGGRRDCAQILEDMGPAAIPSLQALVLELQSYFPLYLLSDRAKVALPVFVEMCKHSDPRVRRRGALGLALCDDNLYSYGQAPFPDAWPHLIACLSDPDPGVTAIAGRALGRLRVAEAAPSLERLLATSDLNPALRPVLEEAVFLVGLSDPLSKNEPQQTSVPLPPWCKLIVNEIQSEHEGFIHQEYSLEIERQCFFLGRRYEEEEPKENMFGIKESWGFCEGDLRVEKLNGHLVQARWTTARNARTEVPCNTTLLLLCDGTGWKEVFRGSVPGYEGWAVCNSESSLEFRWCGKQRALRLYHVERLLSHNLEPGALHVRKQHDADSVDYWVEYAMETSWPCGFENGALHLKAGTSALLVYREEFPISEVAAFLNDAEQQSTHPEQGRVTEEQLRSMNPALCDESLCTNDILYDIGVPPYIPDSKHRYVWSGGDSVTPGFIME